MIFGWANSHIECFYWLKNIFLCESHLFGRKAIMILYFSVSSTLKTARSFTTRLPIVVTVAPSIRFSLRYTQSQLPVNMKFSKHSFPFIRQNISDFFHWFLSSIISILKSPHISHALSRYLSTLADRTTFLSLLILSACIIVFSCQSHSKKWPLFLQLFFHM